MAEFVSDFYAGGPAIARRQVGSGHVWYVATMLEDSGVDWLHENAESAAGLERGTLSSGLEIVCRTNGNDRFLFLLNHSSHEVRADIDAPGMELLTGRPCGSSIVVPAGDVAIVRSALGAQRAQD